MIMLSSVRNQRTQYFVAIIATISIFNCGLHMGWSAPSIPKILSPEYAFEITNDEASYIAVISFVGDIMGGILSSTIVDIVGRKSTIILLTIPQIIAYICIYFSMYSKVLLYIARISGGISEGALFSMCSMYISEISDPSIRGTLGALSGFFGTLGILAVNIIGYYFSLHNAALILAIMPTIFIILFSFMPETPYFYLMKDKNAEAENVLKYLRNKTDVDKELQTLRKDMNRQMSESGTFKDLFMIKSNRKAFLLMIFARLFQQYSGYTAFTYYSQILLKEAVPSMSPVLSSSITLLGQLLVATFSAVLIDKYGRKPLLIASSTMCFIPSIIQAIYFTIKSTTSLNLEFLDLLPLVMMTTFTISFCIGLASIVNILISEMFNTTVKAKATCLINLAYASTALSSTKFYQYSTDNIHISVPFWVFGTITFIGALFFKFLLPETKGKRLEEIQQELKGKSKSKDLPLS